MSGLTQKSPKSLIYRTAFAQRLRKEKTPRTPRIRRMCVSPKCKDVPPVQCKDVPPVQCKDVPPVQCKDVPPERLYDGCDVFINVN